MRDVSSNKNNTADTENMLSIDYLEKIKSHKCNCIFWRDKGVSDFTCLIEDEIKRL